MNVRMLDTDIDLNGHLVPKNVSKSSLVIHLYRVQWAN